MGEIAEEKLKICSILCGGFATVLVNLQVDWIIYWFASQETDHFQAFFLKRVERVERIFTS